MDIITISNEIRNKVNHIVNIKSQSYSKQISSLSEEEQEIKMSTMFTDITFEVSEKIIKDKLSKINPKPLAFSFYVNKGKYFKQTISEIQPQLNEDIVFVPSLVEEAAAKFKDDDYFILSFEGYFLKDFGFIGTKKIDSEDEAKNTWFPSVLNCLQSNNNNTLELQTVKDLIQFGFSKALLLKYVFVDSDKLSTSLNSVDYVIFEGKKITNEEFENIRRLKSLGKGNKKGIS